MSLDLFLNKTTCGDCLDVMSRIPEKSIDMILCDLPYGITRNKWDTIIPSDLLWKEYKRIAKPNAAIVLTATMKFATILIASNPKMFRYDLVWHKNKPRGFLNANKMPLRAHELILVFYSKLPKFNPQKTTGHKPVNSYTKHSSDGDNYGKTKIGVSGGGQTDRYPTSVVKFPVVSTIGSHPTQKPIGLFEWLIKTYTHEGDIVLDNCMGSGTTAVACAKNNRSYVGIDISQDWCNIADQRARSAANSVPLEWGCEQ